MNLLPHIEIEPQGGANATVIWLHGLGADGNDFAPIVPQLKLPEQHGVRFIFPHAPAIPVTINGGYVMPAWYDILDMSIERKVDLAHLDDSARCIGDFVENEINRGVDSNRIYIFGFSQGGAVAYHFALSCQKPLGGLVAMSSYFASKDSVDMHPANATLPIKVYHGTQDDVVSESLGVDAVNVLTERGYGVDYKTYPMAHQVCLEQIHDISRWLQRHLSL